MSALNAPIPRTFGTYDGAGSISGTITDAEGNPAARRIVLLDRSNATAVRRVGSEVDGTYLISEITTSVEFLRIVFDNDAGDLENDLVDRVIAA